MAVDSFKKLDEFRVQGLIGEYEKFDNLSDYVVQIHDSVRRIEEHMKALTASNEGIQK